MDHKNAHQNSAEKVIYGLIGRIDDLEKTGIRIKDDDVESIFEIICTIPFEDATLYDMEPPTTRHSGIEDILSQLQKRMGVK